jgi:hypothetical protein
MRQITHHFTHSLVELHRSYRLAQEMKREAQKRYLHFHFED